MLGFESNDTGFELFSKNNSCKKLFSCLKFAVLEVLYQNMIEENFFEKVRARGGTFFPKLKKILKIEFFFKSKKRLKLEIFNALF